MPLQIIQDEPRKYHFKTKDDQRVNIEHKDDDFIYISLYKWGEETSLQIVLDTVPVHNHTFSENKIIIENPDFLLRVYPIDTRTTGEFYGDSDNIVQCHDGGVRFELVLKKKRPAMDNSITFPLVSSNLRCSYQPFLTQEELDQGIIKPLNVEGSYPFYHATKKNNQYMTGKAFHLFRPIAEDALGVKVWCSLYINPEITELTVTIPQQFLDDATYPIIIDPDLGYTFIGGNWINIANGPTVTRAGSAWTMPAASTANYLRAYIRGSVVTDDCKAFINQKDSGGAGTHGQIATQENLACAVAAHWEEFTLAGEVLANGVTYILNVMAKELDKGQSYDLAYDTDGATAVAAYSETQTYAAPESPWVVNPGALQDYSIFVNYPFVAPGWTGTISGVVNPSHIMGVAVADISHVKGVASA